MYLLSWLVVVIATACVSASRQRRIVGGSNTSVKSFPYHATLEKNGHYKCGGSIISADYILTTAHCVVNYLPEELKVRISKSFPENDGHIHDVKALTFHEYFYTRQNAYGLPVNDIALVKLNHRIVFNHERQPVALTEARAHIVDEQKATIVGWGTIDKYGTLPLYLQSAEVKIISREKCNKAFEGLIRGIVEGQICAGWLGKGQVDACTGDSGGALVIGNRQAGIISWGYECASASYPGIYVDISYYRDWIKNNSGV